MTDILKLHNVTGIQRWCGPAAISAIVGCTSDEAAATLREVTGRRQVTSTRAYELNRALNHYGFRLLDVQLVRDLTFKQWQDKTYLSRGDDTFLVLTGGLRSGHWRVIQRGNTVCSSQRTVGRWSYGPRPNAKVRGQYRVERIPEQPKQDIGKVRKQNDARRVEKEHQETHLAWSLSR